MIAERQEPVAERGLFQVRKQFSSEEQHRRMVETPIPRIVTAMFIPTLVTNLITTIYNTADTFFVSRISTSSAAAVGVVYSLMALIQAVGYGISMGTSAQISRLLGSKENDRAGAIASSGVFFEFMMGMLILVPGLVFLEPLMRLLGATDTVLPHAVRYGRFILIGAPAFCVSFVLGSILRAEGEAVYSMIGFGIGGLINIVLDPIFIFALHMEIAGAAVATLISQIISLTIMLAFFLRGRSIVRLRALSVSRDPAVYVSILSNGLPTIFRQGLGSLSSALLNNAAAAFGDSALAAVTVANKIYMLIRNIVLGIGHGFQPVAGYNFGAGRFERVRGAFRFATAVATGFCLLCTVFMAAFAPQIIGWFRAEDPEMIRIGASALRFLCLSTPMMGYSTYTNQLYQCLGFERGATLLACCRQGFFYVPLIMILPVLIGLNGILLTQPVADLLTFLVSVPCQILFYRHHLPADGGADGPD